MIILASASPRRHEILSQAGVDFKVIPSNFDESSLECTNIDDYSKALSVAANRHDIYGVQVYDKRDSQLPNVGLMRVSDLETGVDRWINTASKKVRRTYEKWWYQRHQTMVETLRKSRVDFVTITTDEDYVTPLMGLFKKRTFK